MAYKGGIWDSTLNDGRGGFRSGSDLKQDRRMESKRWGQDNTTREARKGREADWQKASGGPKDDLSRTIAEETKGQAQTQKSPPAYPSNHGYVGTGQGLMGGWTGGGQKVDRPLIPGGCHHNGQKVAITLSTGKRLYPAQAHQITKPGHLGLIIDCAGLLSGRRFVKASNNPRYRALNMAAWPDVVTLAWPDMTAPTYVGIRFWERLAQMMPEDTAICCMGGHGRTGTALAALLVADGCEGQEAIDRVRAEHCPRAIETKEQETYIRGLAEERKARNKRGK